jgi:multiple sugar transport system permease protein
MTGITQKSSRPKEKFEWAPYGFTAPAAITILLLVVYPIVYGIVLSFFNTNLVNKWDFRGLAYYWEALTDTEFLGSLLKSLIFTFFVVLGHFAIGFLFASFLNRSDLRGRTFFRGVLILPWLFPDVVIAYLFKWILNEQNGILNTIITALGGNGAGWLTSVKLAFPCVILTSIWKGYPLVMTQILAGLQTIPNDYYEAADVDGATGWQKFTNITLPSLKPIMTTVLILDTVWVFKQFTLVYLMTSGGPGNATMVSAIKIYKDAFSYFRYGFASAESVFILGICYLIGFVYRRVLKNDD